MERSFGWISRWSSVHLICRSKWRCLEVLNCFRMICSHNGKRLVLENMLDSHRSDAISLGEKVTLADHALHTNCSHRSEWVQEETTCSLVACWTLRIFFIRTEAVVARTMPLTFKSVKAALFAILTVLIRNEVSRGQGTESSIFN